MEPFVGLLSGIGAGAVSAWGTNRQNEMNMGMAQRQMDFQERMSSTAYQRAVHDMRQAGLNPMLAYQQGGASSPSGATAQLQHPTSTAISSALEATRVAADIARTRAETRLVDLTSQSKEYQAAINSAKAKVFNNVWDVVGDWWRSLPDRMAKPPATRQDQPRRLGDYFK